jgi:hypothetical protein
MEDVAQDVFALKIIIAPNSEQQCNNLCNDTREHAREAEAKHLKGQGDNPRCQNEHGCPNGYNHSKWQRRHHIRAQH